MFDALVSVIYGAILAAIALAQLGLEPQNVSVVSELAGAVAFSVAIAAGAFRFILTRRN